MAAVGAVQGATNGAHRARLYDAIGKATLVRRNNMRLVTAAMPR